jgi:hypothetical protein
MAFRLTALLLCLCALVPALFAAESVTTIWNTFYQQDGCQAGSEQQIGSWASGACLLDGTTSFRFTCKAGKNPQY